MDITEAISFLREQHRRVNHLDNLVARASQHLQKPFTLDKPHTCPHCSSVCIELNVLESGLFYSAALDHTLLQAIDAAISGCELYQWLIDGLVGDWSLSAKTWETPEVTTKLAATGRFELSGRSLNLNNKRGGCSLKFRFVCPDDPIHSTDSQHVLAAWTAAADPMAEYISFRPYQREVQSDESVEFGKDCLRTCMERHIWCRTDQISHIRLGRNAEVALPPERVELEHIPTRLIHVGGRDEPEVKLVEPESDEKTTERISSAGFMALSYCWGGDQPVKLLRDNLARLKQGLRVSALPQTLQDAIWVARTMEFQYLWIDSLCIIQDDDDGRGNNDDKAVEITRMASYYGRATVMLCAASAAKCVDGFLGVREWSKFTIGPIKLRAQAKGNSEKAGFVYLLDEADPPVESTTRRGWTLQESLLSRRILIYAQRQLYWSCLNSFGASGGEFVTLEDRVSPGGLLSLVDGVYPVGALIDYPISMQWGLIVKEYTGRNLGRSDDKLLAISSIAGHMVSVAKARGEQPVYVAGLLVDQSQPSKWLSQLLWHPVTPNSTRQEQYRAPTWSWASMDGPVEVHTWNSKFLITFADVDCWDVDLALSIAPYGSITASSISLTASICPIADLLRTRACYVIWAEVPHFWRSLYPTRRDREGIPEGGTEDRWALLLLPDCPADKTEMEAGLGPGGQGQQLFLVVMMSLDVFPFVGVEGIVAEPVAGDGRGSYRRRGSFQLRAGREAEGHSDHSVDRYFTDASRTTIRYAIHQHFQDTERRTIRVV